MAKRTGAAAHRQPRRPLAKAGRKPGQEVGPRSLLPDLDSPELYRALENIRNGAYAHVAIRAAIGIEAGTYFAWMRKALRAGTDEEQLYDSSYAAFSRLVRRAEAEARQGAEVAVRRSNPLAWLRNGPGRDRPGEPGWSTDVTVGGKGEDGAIVIRSLKSWLEGDDDALADE